MEAMECPRSSLDRFFLAADYLKKVASCACSLPSYFENVARYVMMSASAKTCTDIILVERPYATDIHPWAFSAMSYDPQKSGPTPSTVGLAKMLSVDSRLPESEFEKWFRDSWKFLGRGVFLFNVCVTGQFDDVNTFKEQVFFFRFLSLLIQSFLNSGNDSINLTCIGMKAFFSGRTVASNLGTLRSRVTVRFLESPGALIHKYGDDVSPDDTADFIRFRKGAVEHLRKVVEDTTRYACDHPVLVMASKIANDTGDKAKEFAELLNRLTAELTPDQTYKGEDVIAILRNLSSAAKALYKACVAFSTSVNIANAPNTKEQGSAATYSRSKPGFRAPSTTASVRYASSAGSSVASRARTSIIIESDSEDATTSQRSVQAPIVSTKGSTKPSAPIKLILEEEESPNEGEDVPQIKVTPDTPSVPNLEHSRIHQILTLLDDSGVFEDNDMLTQVYNTLTRGDPISERLKRIVTEVDKLMVEMKVESFEEMRPTQLDELRRVVRALETNPKA